VSINDHIIKAIDQQKVIAFLDLSAAFDTLYYSILIHRLSS
jgi:hypothetical protein